MAEARVRVVPFGIELRIYHNVAFLRSEVSRDDVPSASWPRKRSSVGRARVGRASPDSDQTAGHVGAEAIE
jgi:hypothetical protein